MSADKGILVVRKDGRSQAFSTLVAAEVRAEEWAKESGAVVEIWSRHTGELLLLVTPEGEAKEPEVPVHVEWGREAARGVS